MDSERCRLQIALEIKASLLDEAFVFGIVRDRVVSGGKKLSPVRSAGPAKIGVHEGVGSGQQPRRFRRSVLAQLDGNGHRCRYYDKPQSDRESASNSHEVRSRDE